MKYPGWETPIFGFSDPPVPSWRRDLSSRFPNLYDRSLKQPERARKKAGVTHADLALQRA